MINELESPSFAFGIERTVEVGGGRGSQLIEDLLSHETITTKVEEVTKITPADKKKVEKPTETKKIEEEEEQPAKKAEVADPLSLFDEEKEEKEGDEVKSEKDKVESPEEEKPSNKFKALSNDLFKLGVFSKDEEEGEVDISSPEQFLERFQHEKKKGAHQIIDDFIGQFGPGYQDAFDAIYQKGVDPREYFSTAIEIEDVATVDIKKEENQVLLIRQALKDQNWEAEDITAEIEKLKNYGDLESTATRFQKSLIKNQALKLDKLKKDSEAKVQQITANKNQYIKNVNTILESKIKSKEFDGIPVNPKLAQEIQDFLISEKYKTPSGETLTEFDKTILELKRPENHEKKVKLALLLKILEKDPTLSTIQKTGITKKTDALFGEVARLDDKSSGKKKETKETSSFRF